MDDHENGGVSQYHQNMQRRLFNDGDGDLALLVGFVYYTFEY